MRPMICLLSRGNSRNNRHGPLMTCSLLWLADTELVGWFSLVAGSG
jgi:hypothetical protein